MEIKEIRKEIQSRINKELKFCWICGREDNLTNHHIIHQRIAGVHMNLVIPICSNCSEIIHKDNEFMAILRRLALK